MEVKIQDKQNFGWFIGTHKRVTRFALQDLPDLKPYQDNLEIFAQKPDFDETGHFNNSHYYSPLQQKKSFLDFNKKSNALAKYQEHVEQMLTSIQGKNTDLGIEHAGRALHFLQDMTQPQHTQKGLLFNKIYNLRLHLDFEHFVKKNQADCFRGYVERPFTNASFNDIFMENVRLSMNSTFPTRKTRFAWEYVGRDGINQAIHSTKEFLTKLSRLMAESPQLKFPFA
jgi:hypothetical protein